MDWNLKPPAWSFTDFTQESLPNIDEIGGGSSSFGSHGLEAGDFSVDLKLGQVSNPVNNEQAAGKWKVESFVSKKVSSPLVPVKRPRGGNNGAQAVSCLVDGCYADLSSCREYHMLESRDLNKAQRKHRKQKFFLSGIP